MNYSGTGQGPRTSKHSQLKQANGNSPRKFQAFCIGAAKSGTSSLAGMFETCFRSAHEPEREELLDSIVALDAGRLSMSEFDDYLCERSNRLQLELDSSWANYFIVDRLVVLFPESMFIQLVRDCYTWVESVINHLITRTIPADVQDFMDWWFEPSKFPYFKEDQSLEQIGIYSLECLVTRWRIHADSPSKLIPPGRLTVIRTHELGSSAPKLARFLNTDAGLIDDERSHRNVGSRTRPLLSLVDRAYLEDTVERVCGDIMNQYFPEIRSVDDSALQSRL